MMYDDTRCRYGNDAKLRAALRVVFRDTEGPAGGHETDR